MLNIQLVNLTNQLVNANDCLRTQPPNPVRRGDYGRLLAEFWADGPSSETPPGHWNVLANDVSDSAQLQSRIGAGAASRLRWDVRLYFALNGAVHDAAVAAWGSSAPTRARGRSR